MRSTIRKFRVVDFFYLVNPAKQRGFYITDPKNWVEEKET